MKILEILQLIGLLAIFAIGVLFIMADGRKEAAK